MSKTTISIDEEHFVALLSTKREMQKVDRTIGWDSLLAFLHVNYLHEYCGMSTKEIMEEPDFAYYKDHPELITIETKKEK